MPVMTWPSGLPGNTGQILKNGFTELPPDNILRSDMESGVKQRRKFTRGYHRIKGVWRFSLSDYVIFKTFVETTLNSGIRDFGFNPPFRTYTVAAHFVPQEDGRPYTTASAPGANIFVNFELEFLDVAIS